MQRRTSRKTLTIRALAALAPGEWAADPAARGAGRLQARRLESGELAWYYRYTSPDGERVRLPMGTPAIVRGEDLLIRVDGLLLRHGTIVDATIIDAPSSTKNRSSARDPEMHQTKKGNQWFFGMKAHIGVDRDSGLVHTVVSTAAKFSFVTQTGMFLHVREYTVYGEAGYACAHLLEELNA
jgi:IS5 family transposase